MTVISIGLYFSSTILPLRLNSLISESGTGCCLVIGPRETIE